MNGGSYWRSRTTTTTLGNAAAPSDGWMPHGIRHIPELPTGSRVEHTTDHPVRVVNPPQSHILSCRQVHLVGIEKHLFSKRSERQKGDGFGPIWLWPKETKCRFDTEAQAEFKPLPASSLPPSRMSSRTPAIPGPPRRRRYGASVSGSIPGSDRGTSRAIQCGHCPPQI